LQANEASGFRPGAKAAGVARTAPPSCLPPQRRLSIPIGSEIQKQEVHLRPRPDLGIGTALDWDLAFLSRRGAESPSLSKVKFEKKQSLTGSVTPLFTVLLEIGERIAGVVSNSCHGRQSRSDAPANQGAKTMSKFLKLIKNNKGATAIEYGLIAALIAVAAIGAMQGIGNKLNTTFNNVSNHLN
jgi:pilus assembly protein Flp/PilA